MKRRFYRLFTLILLFQGFSAQARERWLFLGDSITQAGHYVDYIETWMLLNEANGPEIINLGLSSETVSGLSEADHPFPRPCLHTRLDRVLERTKPDLVIACYGMNCGIYHPFSEERFEAYKTGINQLVADAQAAGAQVILLTPPPYAGAGSPGRTENFSYKHPAASYRDVLAKYAEWILSLDGKNGIRAFTVRPALEKFSLQSYGSDPIHPNNYGHALMAETFLQALKKETGSDLLETGISPHTDDKQWNALIKLVNRQRMTYDRALLNNIGHGNPGVLKKKIRPLPEAEEKSKTIDMEINTVLTADSQE